MCVCVCVCVCVFRDTNHVTGQVVQVICGAFQGVCVHVQNDHILQGSALYFLKMQHTLLHTALSIPISCNHFNSPNVIYKYYFQQWFI